jgi:hypothetical protein
MQGKTDCTDQQHGYGRYQDKFHIELLEYSFRDNLPLGTLSGDISTEGENGSYRLEGNSTHPLHDPASEGSIA